mmetsp:Transcript_31115/g.43125  ORF Transcript_31115/g.43125 Transcript_31115/m.43125 type:complete len:218 (+) Transcript_31115:139-792(+)
MVSLVGFPTEDGGEAGRWFPDGRGLGWHHPPDIVPRNRGLADSMEHLELMEKEEHEELLCHAQVMSLLASSRLHFSTLAHLPARTCQESAQIRGASLESGAKAILLHTKTPIAGCSTPYCLAVMSASAKMDSKKMKKVLKTKSLRFATSEEVWEVTRCRPGAVPPFGSIWGIMTICEQSLLDLPHINFNAGLRTFSVLGLNTSAYVQIENPIIAQFE